MGIQPDHEIIDIMESGSWSILSRYYRDFVASPNTPSGQYNIHSSHLQIFSASVLLRHISNLSHVLIEQAWWDDPMVRGEAAILLGNDEKA